MATRKKKSEKETVTEVWPKVIRGSHSTRTEYQDGRVEFVTHWDELERDVRAAILKFESNIPSNASENLTTPKKSAKVNTVKTKRAKNET